MRRHNRQSGLTLMEILIAAAVGGVIATTVGSLFVYTMRQFSTLVLQNKAQQELQWMSYHLQSLFSGSLVKKLKIDKYDGQSSSTSELYSCKVWNGTSCGHTTDDSSLKVASILTDRSLSFTQEDFELAYSIGDAGDTNHSSYVYFIEPYINKPGILCIVFSLGKADINNRTDRSSLHGEACKLHSDGSTVEAAPYALGFKLLGFEAEIKSSTTSPSHSMIIDMTLHNRYFLSSSPKNLADRGHRYYATNYQEPPQCSQNQNGPKCRTSISWKDVSHKLQVNLRNNIFDYNNNNSFEITSPSQVTAREGSFGKILFYKMSLPANSYVTRGRN